MPEIGIVERGIMTAFFEQTLIVAFLDNLPFFHNNDAIRGFDSREAMRDQVASRMFQDQVQCLLDLPLGEQVDAGGGLANLFPVDYNVYDTQPGSQSSFRMALLS
jgi:hypothetical protein